MPEELGVQPLDEVMKNRSLSNDDLVKSSTEQLTHKQVQKARSGKRVTVNIQLKILRALNKLDDALKYTDRDLFNY